MPRQAARREERAWIRAAQAGSTDAAEALFRRHWRPAYRAAYLVVRDGHAAEDIVQEAFLVRTARARPLRPAAAVRPLAASHRGEPRDRLGAGPGAAPGGGGGRSSRARADAAPAERAYSDDVVAALASLSPEQRAVVVMRHVLGYTPGEIAKLLGFPRGTVNSRLRRGLDQLAAALEEERP